MGQIFSQQLKDKLIDFVVSCENLSEGPTLEYKAIPHDIKLHRCEFFKDILSLLNSFEAPDEDRFLIYGIADQGRVPCGYDPNIGYDDATYQDLFNKISPRPNIQFAYIEASRVLSNEKLIGKYFGFFFISSSNFGQVYEMAEEVSDDIPSKDSPTKLNTLLYKRKTISAGASFIRNGSRVRPLTQPDRVRILKFKKQLEAPSVLMNVNTLSFDKRGTSIFALATIFGSWNETLLGDIKSIESASKMSYRKWVASLRKLMASEPSLLAVKGNTWIIPNRTESMKCCAGYLSLAQLQELQPIIKNILTIADPKYGPSADKHSEATYEKANLYSTDIRQGVAEFLAIIGTETVKFTHCNKRDIDQFIYKILQSVICTTDWKILASTENEFPLLAEASPDFYLTMIEHAYENGHALSDFLKLDPSTFGVSCGYGLFTGIQYAAQDSKIFAKAMSLLEKLYNTTPLAAQTIENILLPWRPGTRADIQTRKAMGYRLANNGCWKSLLKLLPGETRTAIPILPPRYLPVIPFNEPVKTSEYREVSQRYVGVAIDTAKGNPDRIIDLLKTINSIDTTGKLSQLADLISKSCQNLASTDVFKIWSELEVLLRHYKAFGKDNEYLDHTGYSLLNDVAQTIKPNDPYLVALFLFTYTTYSLSSDVDTQAVENERENAIDELYKSRGIDTLEHLASKCTELRSLGASMSAVIHSKDDSVKIINWLSKEGSLKEIFAGYVAGIYINDIQFYLNMPKEQNWSAEKAAVYYASLPCKPQVWKAAENTLGAKQAFLYWRIAPLCLSVNVVADAEYAIDMYTSQGRYSTATTYAGMCILKGLEIDASIVGKALQGLTPAGKKNELSAYHLHTVCSYLDKRCPTKMLAWKEFTLFPILRDAGVLRHDSSLYLFKLMSQSSEFFMTILGLLYHKNPNNSNKEQIRIIKERAFEVLHSWHVLPGNTENGIAKDKFNNWLTRVNKLASKANLSYPANLAIGRCFFHAPADVDGLFIDKVVAKYLDQNEQALRGYTEEAFNSQGAIFVDKQGEAFFEIAHSFDIKATELEHAGFILFAAAIRSLAREYETEGRHEKEAD